MDAAKSLNDMEMPNAYLRELFVNELKYVMSAEKQLLSSLKKMGSKAQHARLKEAFEVHFVKTENQIERLKEFFHMLGLGIRAKTCKAMQGILAEASDIIEDFDESQALDQALIAAAQKIEHHEIATYGFLSSYAKFMRYTDAEILLGRTLEEEKAMDQVLTDIALTVIANDVT